MFMLRVNSNVMELFILLDNLLGIFSLVFNGQIFVLLKFSFQLFLYGICIILGFVILGGFRILKGRMSLKKESIIFVEEEFLRVELSLICLYFF